MNVCRLGTVYTREHGRAYTHMYTYPHGIRVLIFGQTTTFVSLTASKVLVDRAFFWESLSPGSETHRPPSLPLRPGQVDFPG